MPNWKRAIRAGLFSGALLLAQGLAPYFADGQTGKPAADAPPGKSIYESRCVACHGSEGKGNEPASALLNPRPPGLYNRKIQVPFHGDGEHPD